MAVKCSACGLSFGMVHRPHRLSLIMDTGLMMGGTYCNGCYQPRLQGVLAVLSAASPSLSDQLVAVEGGEA